MIIALAIVATVSIATLEHLATIARFQRDATELEVESEEADRLMLGFTLMTTAEAATRVGLHVRGRYVVAIRRARDGLFELTVATQVEPNIPVARTNFFQR